jgi:Xaa-Pro aminopeptidase
VEPRTIPGADREMMGFETLTFTPIDLRLIEPAIMAADEIAWLNAYHAAVREKIGPKLDPETRAWLEDATRAIG